MIQNDFLISQEQMGLTQSDTGYYWNVIIIVLDNCPRLWKKY